MPKINIAIDGPAGAGKSTVARLVAKNLGYIYVDTGAMYRAVTWKVLQSGLSKTETDKVVELIPHIDIQLISSEDGQKVLLNNEDITEDIRSIEVNKSVSQISKIPEVRRLLVEIQMKMAKPKGVVMDGRDIGTKVLPHAELKVFLTASVQERARRRYEEFKMKDAAITLKQIEKDIAQRDEMDQQRNISPLMQADDAILLDCTHLSIEEVVAKILQLSRTKLVLMQ